MESPKAERDNPTFTSLNVKGKDSSESEIETVRIPIQNFAQIMRSSSQGRVESSISMNNNEGTPLSARTKFLTQQISEG